MNPIELRRHQLIQAVSFGLQKGWIKLPRPEPNQSYAAAKACQSECMRRRRAELRGEDTSKFAPRVRRSKYNDLSRRGL